MIAPFYNLMYTSFHRYIRFRAVTTGSHFYGDLSQLTKSSANYIIA